MKQPLVLCVRIEVLTKSEKVTNLMANEFSLGDKYSAWHLDGGV